MSTEQATEKLWHVRATGNPECFDLDFKVDRLSDHITADFLRKYPHVTISRNPPLDPDELIVALHRDGKTRPEIGTIFSLSRQRVDQILRRNGVTGHARRSSRSLRRAQIMADREIVYRAYILALKNGDREVMHKFGRALGSQGITQAILKDAAHYSPSSA